MMNIITTALPNAYAGTAYTIRLVAKDGVAPYTWTLVSGTLPTGFVLSPSGTISAAAVAAATVGDHLIRVQCQDAAAVIDTAVYTLRVRPDSLHLVPAHILEALLSTALGAATMLPTPDKVTEHFAHTAEGIPHTAPDIIVDWGGTDTPLDTVLSAISSGTPATELAEPTVTPVVTGSMTNINSHTLPVSVARELHTAGARNLRTTGYTELSQGVTLAEDVAAGGISARLWLYKVGAPTGNVTVDLCQDSAGSPGTSLASATLAISSITTAYAWYTVTLTPAATLTAGTYHIKISGTYTVDDINYVSWGLNPAATYTLANSQYYDGAAWVATSGTSHTFDLRGCYDSVAFLTSFSVNGRHYTSTDPSHYLSLREDPDTHSEILNTTHGSVLAIQAMTDSNGDAFDPASYGYQIDANGFISGTDSGGTFVAYSLNFIVGYDYQPEVLLVSDTVYLFHGLHTTLGSLDSGALLRFGAPVATLNFYTQELLRLGKTLGLSRYNYTYSMPSDASAGVPTTMTLPHTPAVAEDTDLFVDGVRHEYGASYDYTVAGTTVSYLNSASHYVLKTGDRILITYWA